MLRDKILYPYPLGLQDAPIHSSIGESRTFALGFCFCADFSCPASVCPCGSAAQGIFYYKTGGTKDEAKI